MFKKNAIIDSKKPLSKSLLWKFQTDYFSSLGVDAWKQAVPFYVTSNPYIANSYAETFVNFVRDYLTINPSSSGKVFYIIELGTGSGCFSFYALKYITRMLEEYKLLDIKFCYVMTDFTEKNLKFWRQHESLSQYVKQGVLDFSVFNMEYDTELKLTESGVTLGPGDVENPITVFANYIFDTVSHDCFYFKDGEINEALISLKAPKKDYMYGKLKNFDNLKNTFTTRKISDDYYDDKNYNEVLKYFKENLTESYMLFPIASLRTIKNLRKINDKMLLVSSDKAYSSLQQLDKLGEPGIVFHGSFSLMVNYLAVNQYFKALGGDSVLQLPREGLDTFVGLAGMQLDNMPNLKFTTNRYVKEMSPSMYFTLYRHVNQNLDSYSVATLTAHLCFCLWDPHVFKRMIKIMCDQIEKTDQITIDYLVEHMDEIADNFYFMPGSYDILFDVGLFLYHTKNYDRALHYFYQSEKYFGDKFNLRYNIGLCEFYRENYQLAFECFKKCLDFETGSQNAKDWLKYLKKHHSEHLS